MPRTKRIVVFHSRHPYAAPEAPHFSWNPVPGILAALKASDIEVHWRIGNADSITSFVRAREYRKFDASLALGSIPPSWLTLQDKIPSVCHSPRYADSGANIVKNDDVMTGRLLADHIADEGHPHIVFIADQCEHYARERAGGFRDALAARGIPSEIDPLKVLSRSIPVQSSARMRAQLAQDHRRIERAMRSMRTPSAFVCASDQAALVIASSAENQKLRIPEDIALAGVNDMHRDDGLVWRNSGITSVRQNGHLWGFLSIELILDMIDGRRPKHGQSIMIPPRLIVRGSSLLRSRASAESVAFLEQVRTFVDDNFQREHITAAAAQRFGLRPAYFLKKFRRLSARRFTEYVSAYRLERAEFLMRSTRRSVLDVLFEAGFHSANTFYSEFSRRFGISPSAYRRAHERP